MSALDEQKVTGQVASHLKDRYPDRDPAELDALAAERVHAFAEAPVKDYVGPLAEHQAREALGAGVPLRPGA
jgi:hypothetical protein